MSGIESQSSRLFELCNCLSWGHRRLAKLADLAAEGHCPVRVGGLQKDLYCAACPDSIDFARVDGESAEQRPLAGITPEASSTVAALSMRSFTPSLVATSMTGTNRSRLFREHRTIAKHPEVTEVAYQGFWGICERW